MIETFRQQARDAILRDLAAATEAFLAPYDADEVRSWPQKEAAAHRWQEGVATEDDVAMLQTEAEITGEVVSDLVGVILARAQQFRALAAAKAGIRRRAFAALDEAEDRWAVQRALNEAREAIAGLAP